MVRSRSGSNSSTDSGNNRTRKEDPKVSIVRQDDLHLLQEQGEAAVQDTWMTALTSGINPYLLPIKLLSTLALYQKALKELTDHSDSNKKAALDSVIEVVTTAFTDADSTTIKQILGFQYGDNIPTEILSLVPTKPVEQNHMNLAGYTNNDVVD